MKRKIILSLGLSLCLYSFKSTANIVYVDSANISGTHNGLTWATAFSNFQNGIDAGAPGDSVWVAKGTYQAPINGSFTLKEGVKIFGGFIDTTNNFEDRNWQNNASILLGNNATIIANDSNNVTSNTALDGFTITGGRAYNYNINLPLRLNDGGGMRNYYASPIVRNCTFANDSAAAFGGAVKNEHASPQFINCVFTNNSTPYGYDGTGGAMVNTDTSEVVIKNCIFSQNRSPAGASIVNGLSANVSIDHCTFSDNTATFLGAAIYNTASGVISISNCIFRENIIKNDTSKYNGGGAIANAFGASPIITNCLFVKNQTTTHGGAINNGDGCVLHLINCTFSGNTGLVIYNSNYAKLNIANSIIWGNADTILSNYTSNTLSYSLIQGQNANSISHLLDGNTDPMFKDTSASNYHLKPTSPCLNKGNNDSIGTTITTDLAGNPRILYGTVDLGAYEDSTGIVGIGYVAPENQQWTISPNPTTNVININLKDQQLLHTTAILSDAYGRVVKTISIDKKSQPISLAGLANGLYVLKMKNGESVKVVKE